MTSALTLSQWHTERQRLFADLARWRGDLPARGPLSPRILWQREWASHTEIKLTYESEPNEPVPAYLLLPRHAPPGRLPAVLACHQCARLCDTGKEQVVGKCVDLPDQAYGLELVRQGFIVLAPDANKVGERCDPALRPPWQQCMPPREQETCCTAPGGSWGPLRYKPVFDVLRAVDYLSQHPLVDPSRIGAIGHSLGADTILWSMPFEERIQAAVISGGGLIVPAGHWQPYGLPYADILRLIAPRPIFEVNGSEDGVNWLGQERPATRDSRMAGKRAAHQAAREVYRLYGADDRLRLFEFEGGHTFIEPGRHSAYDWLKEQLL